MFIYYESISLSMTRRPAEINLGPKMREEILAMEKHFAELGKTRWADRFRAIRLLADGYSMAETSNILNRPYSTVQQWSRLYRRHGIKGLMPKTSTRGRKKKLGSHERLLLAKAIERGPQAAGYQGNVWTSVMVADYIEKRWNVRYHPGHVRKLLHQLGFSVQLPREKLSLADKEAQEKWLKETYPEIKKTQNP